MTALLLAALRTAAQGVWAFLAAQALTHGVTLPAWTQNWFVETVVVAGVLGLVTWAIRWLESRTGDGLLAQGARLLGKILMLGLSGKQPVYASPTDSPTVIVGDADGSARAAVQ
jgi:hypothetical protein